MPVQHKADYGIDKKDDYKQAVAIYRYTYYFIVYKPVVDCLDSDRSEDEHDLPDKPDYDEGTKKLIEGTLVRNTVLY